MNTLQQILRIAPPLTHATAVPIEGGVELRLAEFDLPNEDGKPGSPAVPVFATACIFVALAAVFAGMAVYFRNNESKLPLVLLAVLTLIVLCLGISQINRLARSQKVSLQAGKITVRTRGIIPAGVVEFAPGSNLKIILRKRRVGPDVFRYRLDLDSVKGHRYVSLGTNYAEVLWLASLFESALDTHVIRGGRY